MKNMLRILSLVMMALLIGSAFAIGSGNDSLFFFGAGLVAADVSLAFITGWGFTGILGINIVHSDILKANGVDNETFPGFKQSIVFALANEVASVPSLPSDPSTNTQRVTITDNLEMSAGKQSFTIEAEMAFTKLKPELVGGPGSRVYKYTGTLRLTGTSVDIEAFGRMSKNGEYFIIPTALDGIKRFLGLPDFPCKLELAEGSMGDGPEDENGVFTEYNFVGYGVTPFPPRWTGTVDEGNSGSGS